MAFVERICRFSCLILVTATCVFAKAKNDLVTLNEETWPQLLEGEWLVKFYAPWCPACRAMVPIWDSVAGWSEDLDITVAKIDVTENPGLSGRFLVTSLPTVYHVYNGEFRVYRGPRAENDIISFVDDKQWKDIEPVPWYTSPTAVHMSALGMFFKASMSIRDLHDKMTTDYGIPVWGSYTIFAVATIIFGLLLGLLLVFMCDCMLPNNPQAPLYVNTRPPNYEPRQPPLDDDDKDSDITDDLPRVRSQPRRRPDKSALPRGDGATIHDSEETPEDGTEDSPVATEIQGDSLGDNKGGDGDGSQEDLSDDGEISDEEGDESQEDMPTKKMESVEASGGDVAQPTTARKRQLPATTD